MGHAEGKKIYEKSVLHEFSDNLIYLAQIKWTYESTSIFSQCRDKFIVNRLEMNNLDVDFQSIENCRIVQRRWNITRKSPSPLNMDCISASSLSRNQQALFWISDQIYTWIHFWNKFRKFTFHLPRVFANWLFFVVDLELKKNLFVFL